MLRSDIKEFINTIDNNVCIVAATKYVDASDMKELLNVGINNFGENRVDSFLKKYDELKDYDIKWHFIGHLQRNKCKEVINKIDYLHSLDSLKLAAIIDKERTTPLNVFIEVSINEEENKNGVKVSDLDNFIEEVLKYKNINLVGFMMMGIASSSSDELIAQFSRLNTLLAQVNKKYNLDLKCLSMGMSDDYKEALTCGATHIRLGRILWN
jgi:pyridoxal phosphate enzyme (YggS family)